MKSKSNINKLNILYSTLQELSQDLKKVDLQCGKELAQIISTSTKIQLKQQIKDEKSKLCTIIPLDYLKSSQQGLKYLRILGLFQPSFLKKVDTGATKSTTTSTPESTTTSTPESTTTSTPESVPGADNSAGIIPSTLPDNFRNLLTPNDSNRDILNLASELFENINLQETLGGNGSGEQLDMTSIMSLFSNIESTVQSKIDSGELNLSQLESQATNLCNQLQQTPEVNDMMESNPQIFDLLNSFMGGGQQ